NWGNGKSASLAGTINLSMPPTCWLIKRRSEWPFSLTSSQAAATPLHKRRAGSSKPLAVMVNLFLIFSLSLGHYQLVFTGRDECKARSRSKLFQGNEEFTRMSGESVLHPLQVKFAELLLC